MKPIRHSPIEFRREVLLARILRREGLDSFTEASIPLEFRFDPLTGRSCRIVPFTMERIHRPDLEALEKRSLEMPCPFCPPRLETVTPKFPAELFPEGNIRCGEAYCFPSTGPYDVYGAVTVLTQRHFIRPENFTVKIVCNGLLASQRHLKRVLQVDPAAKFQFIGWNYLPASGGSLVHPHLQSNAGYHPTTFQKQLLENSERYYRERGTNYWADLLAQEEKSGERYIGKTGAIHWLTAFVPMGRLSDIIALFPGRTAITDLEEKDLADLASGLLHIFTYLDSLKLPAFNLATYSGVSEKTFWTHVRIMPRAMLLYSPIETSDLFYYQVLQDENICIFPPERVAADLKKIFRTGGKAAMVDGSSADKGTAVMACRRCGVCCTRHQAFVTPEEIARISAYLGISTDDWLRLYDDTRWEYANYRLVRHVNGACAFLKYDDGLATCIIHPVKPDCCSAWQPGPVRKECREGMEKASP